jgi:DNA replication and repair protein RecF
VRLLSIELREFRNHRDARVVFDGEPALLLGENGSGKTNLIEAIVLLSIGRSFRGSSDQDLKRRGAARFEVRGVGRTAGGATVEIVAQGGGGGPRSIEVDGAGLPRLSDLLGRFPTVHFSVDDVAVLHGGPPGRRRFLDVALCQLEPAYVGFLRDYVAALKQRNRLLAHSDVGRGRGAARDPAELAVWEEILARAGVELDARRRALCGALEHRLRSLADLLDGGLRPELRYAPAADGEFLEADVDERKRRLQASRNRDARLGWTADGPHRARPGCRIGGEDLTGGASRGMSRLYAILLRLALARVFEERRHETPVILLDDPESELDPRWIGRLLTLVPESSQTVVTACRGLTLRPPAYRQIAMDSIAPAEVAA